MSVFRAMHRAFRTARVRSARNRAPERGSSSGAPRSARRRQGQLAGGAPSHSHGHILAEKRVNRQRPVAYRPPANSWHDAGCTQPAWGQLPTRGSLAAISGQVDPQNTNGPAMSAEPLMWRSMDGHGMRGKVHTDRRAVQCQSTCHASIRRRTFRCVMSLSIARAEFGGGDHDVVVQRGCTISAKLPRRLRLDECRRRESQLRTVG